MRNTALAALAAVIVALSVWVLTPREGCMADGTFPVWMLEAQDYDGGGIACGLPLWQAPPGADWRMYCTGLCQEPNPSDVKFPQP
jgi:hypothetical protein